mmetsp:Transcript_24844/g.32354  ORF Transcript_24844/g.32354 Transcript_24844/m.32354 type:complete len:378 (+) Transcript_24844:179-1312(+)
MAAVGSTETPHSNSNCDDLLNSYNANQSTEENYQAPLNEENLYVGEFIEHRKSLDYNYHKHYTMKRQIFQDEVIKHFLRTIVKDSETNKYCSRPTSPWVVFTAGAMGAGKSHAMKWLSSNHYFPLESFVLVDPDMIRYQLPEMPIYLSKNQYTAGTLTHKESGFIQEILTLEALSEGKNVLIDGSLRNSTWHKILFSRIYKEHPNVKIAIIHVNASHSEVMKRAERRAEITGRIIPKEILVKTLEEVPKSVKLLSPLVNYSVTLNTDQLEPRIESSIINSQQMISQYQACENQPTTSTIMSATPAITNTDSSSQESSSDSSQDSDENFICEELKPSHIESWEEFASHWVQHCSEEEGVESIDEIDGYKYSFDFNPTC